MTTLPPARDDAALAFLRRRRSVSARTLAAPGPTRPEIEGLLEIAARCPDHGMLVPWRFVVLTGAAKDRVAALAREAALAAGLKEERAAKAAASAGDGPVVVAVICHPEPSEKIPGWEQEFSAGAACLSLLNAALASGWGANWLTGPMARNPDFVHRAFGAPGGSFVAGFVHIGTATAAPSERARPDIAAITAWPET